MTFKNNSEIIQNLDSLINELKELNNMIDKKCLNIYNDNNEYENKIMQYTNYIEVIILEHHKICKKMFY